MIPGFNVIVENLDYLLWGRAAAGEPGGVLLSLLWAAGAAALALPGGIVLACVAWRYPGVVRSALANFLAQFYFPPCLAYFSPIRR